MMDYITYSDIELLEMLKEAKPVRDPAFVELYKRHSAKLHAYCLFLTRNRDESNMVFHDSWVKFYYYIHSGKTVNNVLSFLISTAKNIILDNIKRQSRERAKVKEFTYIFEVKDFIPEEIALVDNNELIRMIHLAVDSLDDKYKEPFILKRFEDLPNEEIAGICNESVECIRKRITRATNKVREIVNSYIDETLEK